VIVHNEIAHWAGVRLLGEGRRVAADFEDWHSEDLLPADRAGRPIALIRRVEHTLLHRAAYVTTTSEALATGLHARHGGHRPAVITNSFPLQSNPRTLDPFDSNAPRSFLWFSQTTGPGRGLEFFLAAWARVSRPSKVVLIGEVCAGYDRHLLSLLPEGLRHRLSFLPPVSPGALPGVIAGHDIGLALELNEPENKNLTASNKIFQYLGAGLAVVASDTAGQSEVLARDPNAGILVSLHDTAAFSARLEDLLADPAALRARQFAARRLAESRYCWEHESLRLLESVKRALS
jgi:glycosyltransferase involved in cell wall biosynthesis